MSEATYTKRTLSWSNKANFSIESNSTIHRRQRLVDSLDSLDSYEHSRLDISQAHLS